MGEKEGGGRKGKFHSLLQCITVHPTTTCRKKNGINFPFLHLNVILTLVSDVKEGFIMTSSLH